MKNTDTGLLLNKKDISLHRTWFEQMTKLLGLNVIYRSPKDSKQYDSYGELDTLYNPPEIVGCIYDDHPTQQTMKKLRWNAELLQGNPIIHVPYDLDKLQVGCLFIIPSALDNSEGRVFKVVRMSTISIYPASITCEIGPVLENEFEPSQLHDFKTTDFNLLTDWRDEDE